MSAEICADLGNNGWEHDRRFGTHTAKFGEPHGKWVTIWSEKRGRWLLRTPLGRGSTIGSKVHGPYPTLDKAKTAAAKIMAEVMA